MIRGISRRAALRGIGQSAAIGTLAAALPRYLAAAEAAAAANAPAPGAAAAVAAPVRYCLSMMYPSGKDAKFDADAFRERHLLTLKGAYADSIERVELRVAPTPPAPAEGVAPPPPPPLLATVSMWIRDTTKFAANLKAHEAEVAADIATITNIKAFGQIDEVLAGLGDERGAVAVDSSCLSIYFQAKQIKDKGAATWDGKGYADVYLPKLFQAVGTEAIQRIEVFKGAAAAASMLGSANIYIGDEKKFEEAFNSEAVKLVVAEEEKYSNSPPFTTLMLVRAAG